MHNMACMLSSCSWMIVGAHLERIAILLDRIAIAAFSIYLYLQSKFNFVELYEISS